MEANIGLYLQVKHLSYVTLHIGILFSSLSFSRKKKMIKETITTELETPFVIDDFVRFLVYFTII